MVPQPWQTFGAIALLVFLLAAGTSFAKCSIVLGALRVGLGARSILGAPIVLTLAVLVTAIVMAPTAEAIGRAWEGGDTDIGALWRALEPLRAFAARHASAEEVAFFAELQARPPDDPLVQLSAFMVTELQEAFTMAVIVMVPLLLVDLLVAQVLALIGLSRQPPQVIVVPLKLLLFLTVGGWDTILGGLVEGYR